MASYVIGLRRGHSPSVLGRPSVSGKRVDCPRDILRTLWQQSETSIYWGPGEATTIGCASLVPFTMGKLANCCGGPDSFRDTASWSLAVAWATSLDGPRAKVRMPRGST